MLKVAVQMDPIESINIDGDSSFALMLEAQRRGHELWHYEVRNMSLHEGRLVTNGGRVLNVTGTGDTVAAARAAAYEAAAHIDFPGMHLRTDIAANV